MANLEAAFKALLKYDKDLPHCITQRDLQLLHIFFEAYDAYHSTPEPEKEGYFFNCPPMQGWKKDTPPKTQWVAVPVEQKFSDGIISIKLSGKIIHLKREHYESFLPDNWQDLIAKGGE